MDKQDKLTLLQYLIFIRGKLQHLSIELLTMGEDTSKVDASEKKLAEQIDLLRSQVLSEWQGNADEILNSLRSLNSEAQNAIRQIRTAENKAEKVNQVVSILDQGIALVAKILR